MHERPIGLMHGRREGLIQYTWKDGRPYTWNVGMTNTFMDGRIYAWKD